MRIKVINPNTTESMTRKIGAAALAVAGPGTEIIAVSPRQGPVSIEGHYDEAVSVIGLLEEIHAGEAAETVIHGQASLAEARALVDEGVPIAPLPLPVAPPKQLN